MEFWGGQRHEANFFDPHGDGRFAIEMGFDEALGVVWGQGPTQCRRDPKGAPFFDVLEVCWVIGLFGHPAFWILGDLVSHFDGRGDEGFEPIAGDARSAFVPDACIVGWERGFDQEGLGGPGGGKERIWDRLKDTGGRFPLKAQSCFGLFVFGCIQDEAIDLACDEEDAR